MINQVNLKDEKYLQEYEAQISKLPLEELYEILDIIQKDPSPERIHIVEARIRYLEEHPSEKPEGLFPDLEEDAEDSIKTSECITCPKCLGQKKRLEWLFGKCKKCDGKGFIQMAICPDCLGEGRTSDQTICKTCKGKKIIRANEAKQIKWYQRMCSKFVAKPEILVLSSLATIGALAFCARILSGLYFLDRHFLETTEGHCIIAILVIALICFGIIAEILLLGSKQLPERNHIRNIYILLIIAALGAMVIAGPITGSTCVLEYKAKEYLCNKMECTRVTIHKELSVSDREQELLKDSLNLHTPSFYKGTAYFKNGDSTEVSVIYDRTSLTKHSSHGRFPIPYYTITYRIYAIPGK